MLAEEWLGAAPPSAAYFFKYDDRQAVRKQDGGPKATSPAPERELSAKAHRPSTDLFQPTGHD
jgi:hypothetical protein